MPGGGHIVEKSGTAQGVRPMTGEAILGVNWSKLRGCPRFARQTATTGSGWIIQDLGEISEKCPQSDRGPDWFADVLPRWKSLYYRGRYRRTAPTHLFYVSGRPPCEHLYTTYRFEDD